MTKKLLLIFFFLSKSLLYAQTNINYFLSDTNCPSLPVPFYIDSNQVLDVQWDFCPGDLDVTPLVTSYNNLNMAPRQVQLIKVNEKFYGFTVAISGAVSRINIGNSMNNIPLQVNLQSNTIPVTTVTGIDIKQRGDKFYCFIGDYNTSKIYLAILDSINQNNIQFNELLVNNVGFYNVEIYAQYLFVANFAFNTITKIEFANGFENAPTSTATINTNGLPAGIKFTYDTYNQTYHAFCVKNGSKEITRFDFGNSLNNVPAETLVFTLSSEPYAVEVVNDNNSCYVYAALLGENKIAAIKLTDSVNASAQLLFNNSFPGMNSPLGFAMIRDSSNWHGLAGAGGTLNHFVFSNNCNATPPQNNYFAGSANVNAPLGSYQRIAIQALDTNYITHSFIDSVYFDTTLPEVSFTVNNFCTGLIAQFQSIELLCFDTLVQRYWNFGDNTYDSIISNPTHIYANAGTYTVTFTINTTQGNTITSQQIITVKDAPVADFTFSDNQCADLNVLFTNTSTASVNDTIIQNRWSVENVLVAQTKDFNFTFDSSGLYIIKLFVKNSNGCDDSLIKQITILDSPTPSFTVTNSCIGGTVNFLNATDSNNLNVNYIWNFGDTISSTDVNPVHQYTNGLLNHNVQLISIGSNGCSDTLLQNIHLSVKPTPVILNTSNVLCQHQEIVFANNSFANGVDLISSIIWDFGDSTFSNITGTVKHKYNLPGTYIVTLTAATPTFCDSSVTYTIKVNASPKASYTAPDICFGDTTYFNNTSTVASPDTIQYFAWYLVDIDSSISIPNFSYYYQTGSHPFQLIVVSDSGCVDTLNKDVKVYGVPDVTFSTSNIACTDNATIFNNTTSLIVVDNDSIALWNWNFGDNQFSGLESPIHTYTDTLEYNVSLKATSLFGCKDSLTVAVKVNKSPEPYFTFSPACQKQLTFFQAKDSSATQFPPTTYSWNFGLPNANSTFPNVPYYYDTAKIYLVALTLTYNNGCKQKYLQPVLVNRKPYADFISSGNCSGQSLLALNQSNFYNDSVASYTWSVNGNNISNDTNLTYIPNQSGNYALQLIAISNKTCSDTIVKNVNVNPTPNAAFTTIPTIGALNSPITFSNQTTGAVAYNWSFGDNTFDNTFEPNHTYTTTNNFYTQLIAISDSNCTDTAFQYIKIVESFIDLAVNNVEFKKSNQQLSFSAIVKNNSNIDIQYFTITARIEGLPDIIDNPQIVLQANNGFTKYSFVSSVLLNGNFNPRYVCIEVTKPNDLADQVKANDNACVSITGGFEITLLNTDDGSIEMAINSDIKDECTYEIFDIQGKIISTNNLVLSKGLNYVQLPFHHTNGQYMVRCINKAGDTVSRRLFFAK